MSATSDNQPVNEKSPYEEKFKAVSLGMCGLFKMLSTEVNGYNIIKLNGDLMEIASAFISKTNSRVIIDKFISHSMPYWNDLISTTPDRAFLVKNAMVVFQELPIPDIKIYQDAFRFTRVVDGKTVDLISQKYLDSIWNYLRTLVKFSIAYIHTRQKTGDPGGHGNVPVKEWIIKFDIKI